MTRILFVLKKRENFQQNPLSTGLFNSANFVNEMLVRNGIESAIVVVDDNNGIDRQVAKFRPDIVIIEAVWVVPEKFAVLQRLHPKVRWIVRIHSDIPFMSCEGVAMDWILDYASFDNVRIAPNSPKMAYDINTLYIGKYGSLNKEAVYLPNFYPTEMSEPKSIDYDKPWVDVSCFGAIRPLKNQLIQAVAAVDFVQRVGAGKRLKFHMNTGRVESNGMPVDNNLRGLFQQMDSSRYELIFHKWSDREEFMAVAGEMDIGLQASFSETFNIVGADHVVQGVPFLGCNEVPWFTQGPLDLNNAHEITDHLLTIYEHPVRNVKINQYDLKRYVDMSEQTWLAFVEGEKANA